MTIHDHDHSPTLGGAAMNALSQLVLGDDSTLTIEPLHLSITQKFTRISGTSNLHLMENSDLGVKGHASTGPDPGSWTRRIPHL